MSSQSAISLTSTSLEDSSGRLQLDIFDFSLDLKVKTFYDAVMFHYTMEQWSIQFYLQIILVTFKSRNDRTTSGGSASSLIL